MSILSSIISSKADFDKPKTKTYYGFKFNISMMNTDLIRCKKDPSPTEKRMLGFDLSGQEPIEKVIILSTKLKNLNRFTSEQIREMLSDMGFNVNPTFTGKHLSDIEAVMNVGGYSIPGWIKLSRILARLLPSREKLLVTKLSPGKDRLHIVAYEGNDGSWTFACHTDFNWLSLNLPKIYKSHVGHGQGDYITGTLMFYNLLTKLKERVSQNRAMTAKDIQTVIQKSYNKSVANKLDLRGNLRLSLFAK